MSSENVHLISEKLYPTLLSDIDRMSGFYTHGESLSALRLGPAVSQIAKVKVYERRPRTMKSSTTSVEEEPQVESNTAMGCQRPLKAFFPSSLL